MLLKSVTLILLVVIAAKAQGPPGVPPRQNQQFQQPPPPNQQQQQFQQPQGQQQQFQQPQGQQQQFQQQQFQQQQPNVQEGQGHGHGGGNKLKFASEIHNAEHIIEHLQDQIKTKPKEQMSEEELEFHYFKMHDYDNNNKLDGVEIGKALTHFHDDHEPPAGEEKKAEPKIFSDEEIGNIVDTVISDNDADGDGYVEYFEFKRSQERQRTQDQARQAGEN